MANQIYLAVDIGASSGRVLAGQFDGQRIRLDEVHRFENGPVYLHGRMYWDILSLWKSVQDGMLEVFQDYIMHYKIDLKPIPNWPIILGSLIVFERSLLELNDLLIPSISL